MSPPEIARYDGLADWYDEHNGPAAAANRDELSELLGPGDGPCLDLGCGTGLYADAIRASGRDVVGLDASADQLRLARSRTTALVRADATALPFASGTFPTVVALWVSTDVDDLAVALGEVARVLTPGGLFVLFGAHPCFNGPHTEAIDGGVMVHPVYRQAGWHQDAPWWGERIRRRVGVRHVPLADLLNAVIDAGLTLTRVVEPRRDVPVPTALAVRARR